MYLEDEVYMLLKIFAALDSNARKQPSILRPSFSLIRTLLKDISSSKKEHSYT